MTWQPAGDDEGKARHGQRPLPPVFTQRPDNKTQHASKTFLQESLDSGRRPDIEEQSVCCLQGPGLWEKQGRGTGLSSPGEGDWRKVPETLSTYRPRAVVPTAAWTPQRCWDIPQCQGSPPSDHRDKTSQRKRHKCPSEDRARPKLWLLLLLHSQKRKKNLEPVAWEKAGLVKCKRAG